MTTPQAIQIDFVSDVACPWCAVGLNALERALEEERVTRRREVREVLARVGVRPTPTHWHSTVTTALDPLAETPPDGHRLVAPPVPLRDDPDPTPDLPSSLTPSRAKTDPPA